MVLLVSSRCCVHSSFVILSFQSLSLVVSQSCPAGLLSARLCPLVSMTAAVLPSRPPAVTSHCPLSELLLSRRVLATVRAFFSLSSEWFHVSTFFFDGSFLTPVSVLISCPFLQCVYVLSCVVSCLTSSRLSLKAALWSFSTRKQKFQNQGEQQLRHSAPCWPGHLPGALW